MFTNGFPNSDAFTFFKLLLFLLERFFMYVSCYIHTYANDKRVKGSAVIMARITTATVNGY